MRMKDLISTETPLFARLAAETLLFAGLAQELRSLNRNPEQPRELRANELELDQERIVAEG